MSQAEIAPHQAHLQLKEKISFRDYLKTYNGVEGVRTEWVAGTVESYVMTNNLSHQRLLGFLFTLFNLFLDRKHLGEVIIAGFPMYVGDDKPAREPDLMVILSAHRERIKSTYLDGIADIVVEIVSPESGERDQIQPPRRHNRAGHRARRRTGLYRSDGPGYRHPGQGNPARFQPILPRRKCQEASDFRDGPGPVCRARDRGAAWWSPGRAKHRGSRQHVPGISTAGSPAVAALKARHSQVDG